MPNTKASLWIAVLPALVLPLLASLFYFVLFSEHALAQGIYTGTKVFTLVWPVIAYIVILKIPLPKPSLLAGDCRRALITGLVSGALMVGLMMLLMQTPLGNVVKASAGQIRTKAEELGIINHYWLFAVFLSVVHSLIEEYYWRWFVFGRLRQALSGFAPHLIAGIGFAAHHVVVASQFFGLSWGFLLGGSVAVGGIIWSMMYDKHKTLLGAWISHIIVDFGIMTIGYCLICS